MCVCRRIDPLRFLAACRRRQLNQGLVVNFSVSVIGHILCIIFWLVGVLCLVRYLSLINTSATDCLKRFVSEMTCYVLSRVVC